MEKDFFGPPEEDIHADAQTDKVRLEEKEDERTNLAKKDKVSFTFSWVAIVFRGIVGACVSLFVFTQANRIENEDTLDRFHLLADHNIKAIEENFYFLTYELKNAGSIYRLFPDVTEAKFNSFTTPLIQENKYINEIKWLPLPLKQEDLSPEIMVAVQKAVELKKTVSIVIPLEASKDQPKDANIMFFVPIFDADKNNIKGLAVASIDLGLLVSDNIHPQNIHSANIYVYDNTSDTPSNLLFFYDAETGLNDKPALKPNDLTKSEFTATRTVNIGDRNLTFLYDATPEFTEHTWQPTIAAGIGTFITIFIVVSAWILLEIEKRQFSDVLHEEHIQEIEGTIDLLETTKNRMVAQENLASLGGLTAGIAHEIKNPLNFINNFSTVSLDLINEIDLFLNKYHEIGTAEERDTIYESILSLKENVTIIHDQGERADNTIQRMLAHSRGKAGEWNITDIHKLLDEYISFSFHGMRAHNSNFNVKIEKEFNSSVKDIEVVSNDLSRVFLNLLNNAFQSIDEKRKKFNNAYTNPLVTIKTQTVGNYIRIRITDNGLGISEENKSNIFTPFFTTKPTGVGTGLGLSLSYNIIVREHGGSLTFDSKENEYCEFIITIPIQSKKEKEVVLQ